MLGVAEPLRDRPAWAAAQRDRLVAACGGADVLLTLDVDGVVRLPGDSAEPVQRTRAHPTLQSRACGAGDTFTAAYTAARCADLPPPVALAVAQAAADVVVGRDETAVCTTSALTAQLAAADRGGLLSHRDLLAVVDEHRRRGHAVVFTNGCFDVLHRGHVTISAGPRAGRPAGGDGQQGRERRRLKGTVGRSIRWRTGPRCSQRSSASTSSGVQRGHPGRTHRAGAPGRLCQGRRLHAGDGARDADRRPPRRPGARPRLRA